MFANLIAWVMANWQPVVVAVLAIDAALIPLFPNAGILGKIKSILTDVAPKA
jgi:hypothetical protein